MKNQISKDLIEKIRLNFNGKTKNDIILCPSCNGKLKFCSCNVKAKNVHKYHCESKICCIGHVNLYTMRNHIGIELKGVSFN